jgi:hypothetical protein
MTAPSQCETCLVFVPVPAGMTRSCLKRVSQPAPTPCREYRPYSWGGPAVVLPPSQVPRPGA